MLGRCGQGGFRGVDRGDSDRRERRAHVRYGWMEQGTDELRGCDYPAHPWAWLACGGEGGIDRNHPGFDPAGALRFASCVQIRSRRICRTRSLCDNDFLSPPRPSKTKKAALGGPLCFWRRGWDSNPRYGSPVHLISSQARSTTPAPLRCSVVEGNYSATPR